MRPKKIDIDVADENTAGYADDDSAGDAGAITLAVTTPTDGLAHKVVWTPATGTGVSGDLTLVGTDADDKAITETVATNGATAITSTKFFKTLSSATNPTVGANTVDLGWADEVASKTIPLDHYASSQAVVQVDVTGTINYDIEVTGQNPYPNLGENSAPFDVDEQADLTWVDDGNFTGKTATLLDDLATEGVRALRVVVNSYSSGAELQVHINQPR